jgi:hypothetical protein
MVRAIPTTRRLGLVVGAAAGGLILAALLPIAVAFADIDGYVPDPSTFDPTQVTGFPPFTPEVQIGQEHWNLYDFTTNTVLVPDQGVGVDTYTVFGSFSNDDFSNGNAMIDLANFGGGWENEWVDLIGIGAHPGISDLLITPFGDFPLFGTAF